MIKAVKALQDLKGRIHRPYRVLCPGTGMNYSTFMRWKGRLAGHEPLIKAPGPKKVAPIPSEMISWRMLAWKHGRKRTAGTGTVYLALRRHISRRTVQRMARALRLELWAQEKAQMRRIRWLMPGLVWSMDDTWFIRKALHVRVSLHHVYDLGAKYTCAPVTTPKLLNGPSVALNLARLFAAKGAPLVIKRDNGGNLNDGEVDAVLAQWMVIALNSPAYYPPYNGAIEKGQFDLKKHVAERIGGYEDPSLALIGECAVNAAHSLNHSPRRSLQGQCGCGLFLVGMENARAYDLRHRKEMYENIVALAMETLEQVGKTGRRAEQAAWRLAVETWLLENGVIAVTQGGEVLPYSSEIKSHN